MKLKQVRVEIMCINLKEIKNGISGDFFQSNAKNRITFLYKTVRNGKIKAAF